MAAIQITDCRGMSKKIDPKKLPEGIAQAAYNVQFGQGHIRPINQPYAPTSAISLDLGALTSSIDTIFKTSSGFWLGFNNFTTVMESPVPQDTYKRIYSTGHLLNGVVQPRVRDGQSQSNLQNQLFRLGVPKPSVPTVNLAPTSSANTATENPVSRAYAITYVTAFGEEGPPSDSVLVDVYTDQTVTVFAGNAPASRNITSIRLYRTDEDGTFRVHGTYSESAIADPGFVDSLSDSQLGEELPSTNWKEPPTTIEGIMHAGNGIVAAFDGNTLLFSERYLPHAWPEEYRLTTNSPIVALANLPEGILVLTKGKPALATGNDPSGMTLAELDFPQACISKRGVVEMGTSVLYPSPDGMIQISASGGRNLTEDVFTGEDWRSYAFTGSDRLQGFFWEGQYVGFDQTAETANNQLRSNGFILDPRGGGASFSFLEGSYGTGREWGRILAGFNDLTDDKLYLASYTSSTEIVEWAESDKLMEANIDSAVFYSSRPINFGALRVNAESLGGFSGTVTLYGMGRSGWSSIQASTIDTTDNSLGMGHESDSEQIERMPSGTKYNEVYIKLKSARATNSGKSGCSMIKYVESMQEL